MGLMSGPDRLPREEFRRRRLPQRRKKKVGIVCGPQEHQRLLSRLFYSPQPVAKMGVGRRMKKQGPPAPLDESKITILKKRKASEAESKPASDKKRRTAKADDETRKSKPKTKANQITNGKAKNGASRPERSTRQKKNHPKNPAQFFESDDELSSDHDAEDLMGDEFDDLDGVSDGSVGSKDEGSVVDDDSVFDSEEDHARETLFSEDEDVSDAEEQLTAANIEGLSKKLDMQRQAEEEEAQRDLQESAMQTNIAGDRPDVFGDEGARPGLAPDLQFLRTRITDTIRILGDLAKLGQPGKSRTDYVDLLISDICTYYGYTPFLAEKLFSLFTPMEAFAFFEANETPVSRLVSWFCSRMLFLLNSFRVPICCSFSALDALCCYVKDLLELLY